MSKNNIINEILQLRNQKLSYQKIADNLNERQISKIKGHGKWNRNEVSRIVSNKNDELKILDEKDLTKVLQDKKFLIIELDKVKQINTSLNEIKHDNDKLAIELISVKQQNSELQKELNKVKLKNKELYDRLNKVKGVDKKESTDQEKKNIDGWSIQKSGGYYRLFKKIAGKVHGIYLGKTIDEEIAKNKILTYLQGL